MQDSSLIGSELISYLQTNLCTVERRETLGAQGFDSSPRRGGGFFSVSSILKFEGQSA